jgi:hypothetical protein
MLQMDKDKKLEKEEKEKIRKTLKKLWQRRGKLIEGLKQCKNC